MVSYSLFFVRARTLKDAPSSALVGSARHIGVIRDIFHLFSFFVRLRILILWH